MNWPQFGILDFGYLHRSAREASVLKKTIRMAQEAEDWGYKRLWIAEHHTSHLAWTKTETILALMAASTKSIRIGAGGVQILNYPAYQVASEYKILSALFPERIDLGMGQGTAQPFKKNISHVKAIHQRTKELVSQVAKTPMLNRPEVWMLGSSLRSGKIAMTLKTAYCHSMFHSPGPGIELDTKYLSQVRNFCRQQGLPFAIAIAGHCTNKRLDFKKLFKNSCVNTLNPQVLGSAQQFVEKIEQIVNLHQPDEIIYFDVHKEFEKRRKGYQLLSRAMGL